ncbi:hypothetical protein BDAP_000743 [Binucleata daphniae]
MIGQKGFEFTADAYHKNKFTKVSLKNFKGKYTVLVFYPFDFTFVCPTEIKKFCEQRKEYEKLNAEVIFISVDSVYAHKAWTQLDNDKGGIGDIYWPMAADVTRNISNNYKMLSDDGVSKRGTLVLDKDLVVRYQCVLDNKIGRSSEDVLRVVGNIKMLDENKDVTFCAVDYNAKNEK